MSTGPETPMKSPLATGHTLAALTLELRDRACSNLLGTLSRRGFLEMTAIALAAGLGVGCTKSDRRPTSGPKAGEDDSMHTSRMPLAFLPHGGGPWPFIDHPSPGHREMYAEMSAYMRALHKLPPISPRAVLLISAHWEEAEPTVMTSASPPMLYDYGGFPPETYRVQWPAPGSPEVASEVVSLLQRSGLQAREDANRGFDHGVFVPLKLAYPTATVPTLQLSLKKGLDPREHIAIGRALAPLRDQGVFIVGSGMSYHNMRAFMQRMRAPQPDPLEDSVTFDAWLTETMALEASARETRLVEWERAPQARSAHPREEHLMPLHVLAGAAGDDPASIPYRDTILGARTSAVHFEASSA